MTKLARRDAPGETSSSVLLPNGAEDGSLLQPRILPATASGRRATNLRDDIPAKTSITWKEIVTVAVLCFVNLINYMDRFTIAGNMYNVAIGNCGPFILPLHLGIAFLY